jgi:hypothetical protein
MDMIKARPLMFVPMHHSFQAARLVVPSFQAARLVVP